MNTTYEFQVESMHEAKKWVDQFGAVEDKITPAQSIQERVHEIKSNTEGTPISSVTERIMRISKNVMLPQLRKLLDANGHIRSGQQKEDVKEALRLFYYDHVQSKSKKGKQSDSDGSGEEGLEKTTDAVLDDAKVQAAKDRFHPPEMYVFFHEGPAVIGGQHNLHLLQDPAAMQRAVGAGGGASRQTHRDNMNDRVQEEARTKKKKLVTQTLTNALLNASPTPSCSMSSASPEVTVSTTSALEAFLRERREMDRRWVATDRLAGKVVLCTLYAALVPCPCFFCPALLHANCIHICLHIPIYTYFCILYMHIHAFYIIIYIYIYIYISHSCPRSCDRLRPSNWWHTPKLRRRNLPTLPSTRRLQPTSPNTLYGTISKISCRKWKELRS